MSLDSAALALATTLKKSLRSGASRIPVTMLVYGQSTEQGPVPLADKAQWPSAFVSARNPGFMQKRLIPVANRGGWWPALYDIMFDWGYDLDIINAAVGGASILTNIVGIMQGRSAANHSTPFYQRRSTGINYPDLGDFGDLVQITNNGVTRHFVVVGGPSRQCFNAPPFVSPVGAATFQDYVSFGQSGERSGTVLPDVSTVPVGGTITDGTITLMRVESGFYGTETVFYPGIDPAVNGGQPNFNLYGIMGERAAGYGFDPCGIIAHGERMAQNAAPAERKIVYFSNGQADLGIVSATYQRACMMLANFYLRRGWEVMLGNTIFSPASAGSTIANYQAQIDGVDAAIAALGAVYPGKIRRGANLHAALGRTGVMGGQRCTGGVAGTTLTISATLANSGSGIAVGQRVWNGTSLVGIISALGSGTGGNGTYTVDRAAAVAAGTSLVCAGSGLQYDGIHQNGSVIAQGAAAIAASLRSFLPHRM